MKRVSHLEFVARGGHLVVGLFRLAIAGAKVVASVVETHAAVVVVSG